MIPISFKYGSTTYNCTICFKPSLFFIQFNPNHTDDNPVIQELHNLTNYQYTGISPEFPIDQLYNLEDLLSPIFTDIDIPALPTTIVNVGAYVLYCMPDRTVYISHGITDPISHKLINDIHKLNKTIISINKQLESIEIDYPINIINLNSFKIGCTEISFEQIKKILKSIKK